MNYIVTHFSTFGCKACISFIGDLSLVFKHKDFISSVLEQVAGPLFCDSQVSWNYILLYNEIQLKLYWNSFYCSM